MTTLRTPSSLSYLFSASPAEGRSDRDLLDAFAAGEEAAFSLLVERHGGLVLSVCRRVLGNAHDAEDAFQAAFLALARKSRTMAWRDSIAGWLHDVAWRSAVRLRTRAARRHDAERQAVVTAGNETLDDLQVALDEEVRRLPAPCREAIVRCYFEGQTRSQAARQLGWSQRTLERRLEQGRQRLRLRLEARGLTLAVLLALAPATLPSALARSTTQVVLGQAPASSAVLALAGQLVGATTHRWFIGLALLLLTGLAVGASLAIPPAPHAVPHRAAAPVSDPVEGPLPPGALARFGTTRFRHGFLVNAIAFSPDGQTIASAGNGRGLCLWEAGTGRLLHHCNTQRFPAVYGVAFSPDGKTVAAAEGATLRLWSRTTGKIVREFKGHANGIVAVAFSPDGKRLASGSHDFTVRLWDPTTGNQRLEMTGHTATVWSVAYAPGGQFIASAGLDGTVRIWSALTGRQRHCFKGHGDSATSVTFHPEGKLVASAGSDGQIRIWSLDTEQLVRAIPTGVSGLQVVAFSPDGKRLAAGKNDRTIRLYDPDTGREVRQWDAHAFRVNSLAWSSDGKRLASAAPWDSAVRLWDPDTGKEIAPRAGHTGPIDIIHFLADGKRLISYGRDQRLIHWDLAAGKGTTLLDRPTGPTFDAVAVAPDGAALAVGSRRTSDGSVQLITTVPGAKPRLLGKHNGSVHGVAFTPDSKRVVSLGADLTLRLVDATTGATLWENRDLPRNLARSALTHPIVFSPDGKQLAFSTGAEGVWLVDAATGKRLRRHPLEHEIGALAFSPDGSLLAVAGGFRQPTLLLWNTRTGTVERSWTTTHTGIYGIAFSHDGRLLASAGDELDSAIRLWDLLTGKLVATFQGHHSAVLPVAFSRDGRTLASGGGDAAIVLWDVTGRGQGTKSKPAAARCAVLWDALAGDDVARAQAAIWELADGGPEAVAFLRARLAPVRPVEPKQLDRLLLQLDADDYATRTQAGTEIEKLGWGAEPALRRALAAGPSLEPRRRIERILDHWERSADWLRYRRALAALEHARTPAAQAVLRTLASGLLGTRPTEEARTVLARLAQPPG